MQGAVSELPRATGRRTQAHARFGLIDRGRLAALEFHTPSTACPLHRGRRRPSLSIKRSRTQLQLARPAPQRRVSEATHHNGLASASLERVLR